MARYFISQVMNGKTDEEILAVRNEVAEKLRENNPKAEIIDSFVRNTSDGISPICLLGVAIVHLANADMCVFVDHCEETARGCKIEKMICDEYGIDSCIYRTDIKEFEAQSV